MITTLLLVPVIGSLFLLPLNENTPESRTTLKQIAIATSLINLLVSVFLWINFDSSSTSYQFVYEFNKISSFDFNLGIDGTSLYFVLLTTFVTPIAIISNYTTINKNLKYFLISFLLLETLQILTFVALDLLLFYIFFESVLPILFIIIIVYGSGKNRTRSALLLFLYTLLGSLPMLLSILSIQSIVGSTDFLLLSLLDISLDSQKILWLGFFIAFAVKTPLWPLTMWLPRAHSDSPLAGSVLLAGTILKLATYGMLRILLTFLPDASNYFSPMVQTIAVISIIYASLATIIQQDTKTLIAYSSICHMGVVVLGIFSNTIQGIEGAILLGIAHGFVSPALFICIGGVVYDRTGTRLIKYLKGLATYMPIFTILFFAFTLCNIGTPLSLNFLGEQMSLIGIWQVNPVIAILGGTGIVLSACYSVFLYNRISYGAYSPHLKPLLDISRREFVLLISLLIPTLILGIYPNVILETIHVSTTQLLYTVSPLFFLEEPENSLVCLFKFKASQSNKKKQVNSSNDPNNNLPDFKFYVFLFCFIFSILVLTPNDVNLQSPILKWVCFILLLWIIGWFIHSFVKTLLFVLLAFEMCSIPKNLPKLALNWIKRLDTESKLKMKMKKVYLRMYLVDLLFLSVTLFIFVLTCYFMGYL